MISDITNKNPEIFLDKEIEIRKKITSHLLRDLSLLS